jgi:hypothetical protein
MNKTLKTTPTQAAKTSVHYPNYKQIQTNNNKKAWYRDFLNQKSVIYANMEFLPDNDMVTLTLRDPMLYDPTHNKIISVLKAKDSPDKFTVVASTKEEALTEFYSRFKIWCVNSFGRSIQLEVRNYITLNDNRGLSAYMD